MLWSDSVAFALLGAAEWVFVLALVFFFCVSIAALLTSIGGDDPGTDPMVFGVIAAIFAAVLGLVFYNISSTAEGIRAAVIRPDTEMVVEGQRVEMRAPEVREIVDVAGREIDEIVHPRLIVSFPYSRLKALERALQKNEGLGLALAAAKERSGCCEASSNTEP